MGGMLTGPSERNVLLELEKMRHEERMQAAKFKHERELATLKLDRESPDYKGKRKQSRPKFN